MTHAPANFASDNIACVAPEIMEAIVAANAGTAMPYGADDVSAELGPLFSDLFETEVAVFPVATGTAANVLSLSMITPPYGAIYLSFRVNLFGQGFDTNEQIRRWLLDHAGLGVVPFQAFDLPQDSGWFRMAVGAISLEDIDRMLERLESALHGLKLEPS